MAESLKYSHQGRVIRTEIRTSATPEQAWAAWTDPQKIAQWFVDTAEGEPRAGTTFTWKFDRFNYVIPNQVLEAIPQKLFVLKGEMAGHPRILEITIARESGETIVRLVNSGFLEGAEWDEEFSGSQSGWQMACATLKYYLENYFGQPKTLMLAMRPAQFEFAQLMPYYREEEKLALWLTTSGGIGNAGETVKLMLKDDATLSGKILTITKTEVLLSWSEIRGVFSLKAFSAGPGKRMVCLHALGWGLDAARPQQIEAGMNAALERLATVLGAAATAKT